MIIAPSLVIANQEHQQEEKFAAYLESRGINPDKTP
jgi:hypothetical protein